MPGIGSRGGSAGGLGIWAWIITLHEYHKSSRTSGSMPRVEGFRMKEAVSSGKRMAAAAALCQRSPTGIAGEKSDTSSTHRLHISPPLVFLDFFLRQCPWRTVTAAARPRPPHQIYAAAVR